MSVHNGEWWVAAAQILQHYYPGATLSTLR
jgi:hypothetical protein